ncbi:PAS domain-containing protein [Acetobacteraceae bacterium H6797]|nr:PAS domain-containing protein [Acetobacteraceae bacterium H6797]
MSSEIFTTVSMPDAVWRSVNPAFTTLLGWHDDEVVGLAVDNFIHPADRTELASALAGLKAGQEIAGFECRMKCSDGDYCPIAWRTAMDQPDGLTYWVGTRAVPPQLENEEKYRNLFNSMDQGYCIIQILYENGEACDWRFIEVNPAFEKHNGLHDAAGKRIRELAPDIEKKWIEIYARVAETGESLRFEETSSALDGRVFDLYAFRVGDPEARKVAVLFQDITSQRMAEAALRESEEMLRQFGNASSDGLWIRTAATLVFDYASPAMETIYGVTREALKADPRLWAALIVPDDRADALDHFNRVLAGEALVHEFRILRPSDNSFRWVRSVGFPLFDERGRVQRIAGISSDVTTEKQLAQHQAVLLAELQHRVRNVMAIVRSIIRRSAQTADGLDDYVSQLSGRIATLARVQALLTHAGNRGVQMERMIRDELAAQSQHEGQYELSGPDILLSPKISEVLTLVIHELTTNALKYGALSVPEGRVRVTWAVEQGKDASWLRMDWSEEGAPARQPGAQPPRKGFGTELIEKRIPYELRGLGSLEITPEGAQCCLQLPLLDGASIFETEAPQVDKIFGGSIDMTKEADLAGIKVLVLEDDYYLATDTARALGGAGATLLGPCPTEEAAMELLRRGAPSAAVLDINIGEGPAFRVARLLRAANVPLLFVTGYDPENVPDDLQPVPRLHKPAALADIVAHVAKLAGR